MQLPKKQERKIIDTKLSELLKLFKTDELSIDEINEEVELVRAEQYKKQKNCF